MSCTAMRGATDSRAMPVPTVSTVVMGVTGWQEVAERTLSGEGPVPTCCGAVPVGIAVAVGWLPGASERPSSDSVTSTLGDGRSQKESVHAQVR